MPQTLTNPGLALRAVSATVSPAAGIIRAGDIAANPGSYEIAVKPKTLPDQLKLPCCVSCALNAAMEALDRQSPALSPLFHYHVTRFDNDGADPDGFLYLDDGLTTITNQGICRSDLHQQPFTDAGAQVKPSTPAYDDADTRALHRRNLRLRYVSADGSSRAAWARQQLRQDRPIVVGFHLPTGYSDAFLDTRFEWTDPNKFQPTATGHCVLCFGYDDGRQCFHIQDSQGPSKFEQGTWWLGYRILDSPFVQDVYCLIP